LHSQEFIYVRCFYDKLIGKERSPTGAFFGGELRTIEWLPEKNQVSMIDQRRLPRRFVYLHCHTLDEMVEAIRSMAIRGAPALAVAGAYGMVLAARKATLGNVRNQSKQAADLLIASRPTAINLAWGVNRMLKIVNDESISDGDIAASLLTEAHAMAEEDILVNRKLAENGASLINDGDTIIHHCNTGSLAVVDWGTALGAIRYAHEQGKHIHLLVDETRPRLQGSRLTAWECEQYGIPYEIITDNAAGYFLRRSCGCQW
jgi:methylthioribose-1-phosphate isomerase